MFLSQAFDRVRAFSPEQFNGLGGTLSLERLSECLKKAAPSPCASAVCRWR